MEWVTTLLSYIFVQTFGLVIAYAAAGVLIYLVLRKLHSQWIALALAAVFVGVSIFFYAPVGLPRGLQYPFSLTTFGPAEGPVLPFGNVIAFFKNIGSFERVSDIARDPTEIPPPIARSEPTTVKIALTTKEVIAEMAPGVYVNYWTFDGRVPGPFLRVREGDTVELTLTNDPASLHHHSIDLHAVTGPGGGAVVTMVEPGESKTLTFKALRPGLFVYHCAEPNVANHMTHGMYGLILVEPAEGLPPVDRELYVMQGEFYTTGDLGKRGLQIFDARKMLDGTPQYIVWNGRVKGLVGNMTGNVGETLRIFVGNGGVNLASNFHVIGEIFDTVYPEAALRDGIRNVQTTVVPAGGASVVEFDLNFPGNYAFVDHALARLDRGAWGVLHVEGEADPTIFDGEMEESGGH
ncbi:nitrite reductase, copper-containing [Candidatus Kaiserbacteria bacterium RIFCSPLOWO2_01_FULL_54_13]|uniref:Copper-containing nitrite reductase n=1 Tax=Candidatus Kaiserbacteria bacterium RIFCSPLOWO2_01_FULL_54_13 TaxID=1798512 RepID=A0A1F6F291_9BACT|nr:MAG: nitrite reductase, copper-containing [Candidatus Kaiserbacteria bacterium RIFCSPLOWO2_01_FULL_54_13]